jgi:Arc/MetJ-type ribon-helix-helix transcriptional regulator
MKVEKIAVSLPAAQIAAVRRAVRRGRAASVSAYVSQAIARRERDDSLASIVADLIAKHGEPSPEDYAWADRALART